MFPYYFGLALRSLAHKLVLTVLMIAAIGVGIGASMTTLTIFRAMSGDPIPNKSGQLFVPQIDNWGLTANRKSGLLSADQLPDQLSYTDAMALMQTHAAKRQAAMYVTRLAVTPSNPQLRPFQVDARATYEDFFAMFEVPFIYGGPWSKTDDESHAAVLVITRELNDRLFKGANSVGKTIDLDNENYRIVGVLSDWRPVPRFYDLNNGKQYGKTEQVFLPFTRAIDQHKGTQGNNNCKLDDVGVGWDGHLRSSCVWIQYWAELPTPADANGYRAFLNNYAAEQYRTGRFHWPPNTQLSGLRKWLDDHHVVSDEVRILVAVSFSFLFVCLLNAMSLMLAKIIGRASDVGVRRALGANRRAIFAQYLVEACVIGVAGGLLGLLLTAVGLMGVRSLVSKQILPVTHLDLADIRIALLLAILATVTAALYPTWRAIKVQPAQQLKVQ